MSAQRPWLADLRAALGLMQKGDASGCLNALEKLSERYPGDALCRALVLDGVGRAHFALQQPEAAVEALNESLALLRANQGETSPMTLGSMQNLSRALLGLGKIEESQALGSEALRLTVAVFGPDAPQTAEARLRLSTVHYKKRDFDRAESLLLSAKQIWERRGEGGPQLGVCLNNLGRIAEERGELEHGIALHRQALDLRRRLLGEHEDTAFSLGNLGVALATAGRWAEAEAALRESVDMYGALGLRDCSEARGYAANLETCRQALKIVPSADQAGRENRDAGESGS